jgi:methylthioribose-1-phosphate isomerase
VPLIVAAPVSTLDPDTPTGADIVVERRDGAEVTSLAGSQIAPQGTSAANWAFDVTPHPLVGAIVTDAGVLQAPYDAAIARVTRTAPRAG